MGSICDDSLRPPLTTHVSRETLPLKRVRITLPPSPPPDVQMSQNSMEISPSQPRRSQRTNLSNGGRVVLPTDHVDEQEAQHRLRSGSKWRQHDLALFKVKFEPNEDSELPMLNIEHEWNLSQRQRVDVLVQQLMSITPEMLKGPNYQDDIDEQASRFEFFFSQLRLLLSDNVDAVEDEITFPVAGLSLQTEATTVDPEYVSSNAVPSASETKKRPNSLTITTSSPIKVRLRSSEDDDVPMTPDRPTISKNPAYSGDSIESTEEDNTKRMVGTLIESALLSLRSDFVSISWPKYAQKCRLRSSGQERLKFMVGRKSITAINDGSIIIEYSRFPNRVAFWGLKDRSQKFKSVVSIEAKRKREKGIQADWRHAGQIFCEMLGQICHPEIYSIAPHEFLEAFVIHARHTTVRLFYCKFPVTYLRNIAKHGERYKNNVPKPQGVHLQHTKSYYLSDPSSRGDFFRIIARLIWYLSSGKCHVPYLWNREDNPINSGHWIRDDDDESEYWIEEIVPWGEPVYFEEEKCDEESPSPVDEESGSEFMPSGSASE